MEELGEQIIDAWLRAADELGIRFVTPYHMVTPDHRRMTYLGLVEHFGGTTGTVLRLLQLGEMSVYEEFDRAVHIAKLGEQHAHFDPLVFRGTLIRWGYTGPSDKRPSWMPVPRER